MLPREWVRDIIRLDSQSLCPKCGADWNALGEMLNEYPDSDNFRQAVVIAQNCPICAVRFQTKLDKVLQPLRIEKVVADRLEEREPRHIRLTPMLPINMGESYGSKSRV
jgi:transcription elongation factor Elf1